MPGFDKTGPRGQGPLTGGRRGRCTPMNQKYGYGRSIRRGMGRRFRQGFAGDADVPNASELNDLKARVSDLGDQLTSINRKLDEQSNND